MKYVGLLFILLSACSPKDAGYITLINSDVVSMKIFVDDRSFTLYPSNHITKSIKQGVHEIRQDGSSPVTAEVIKDLTTVFDSTGLSCMVVADFTERYKGGPVKIAEKFVHQQVFTTKAPMISVLGAPLPQELGSSQRALRLHQVDCEIVGDDNAIAVGLMDTP